MEKSEQPGHSIIITLNGIAKTVMMSVQDFEDWKETLEIMSDKQLKEPKI
ncbi:type II toxin-antitoxin system Phd/YefM family antitoxin [Candidatus Peregrinibacteria bacterium]|nr:type II toxin-antitoxin system Phd/YefM family antitoxin [Candidatus Peregrinibacteria bacterium]